MHTCPQCGKMYSDLVKVCPDCKVPLNSGVSFSNQAPQSTYKAPAQPAAPAPQAAAQQQPAAAPQAPQGQPAAAPKASPVQPVSTPPRAPQAAPQAAPQPNVYPMAGQAPRTLGFGELFRSYFANAFHFKGRACRRELLFGWIFSIVVALIPYAAMFLPLNGSRTAYTVVMLLISIVVLCGVFPVVSLFVRRLHDTGRSGWFYFIGLIPFVGSVILLVLCLLDSTGDNKYGPRLNVC